MPHNINVDDYRAGGPKANRSPVVDLIANALWWKNGSGKLDDYTAEAEILLDEIHELETDSRWQT